MVSRKLLDRQTTLSSFEASTSRKVAPVPNSKPDILAFIITTIDPGSGSEMETLSLQGTNLPFQPFVHPVTQEIHKLYYPGGPVEREPTVQVLGSIEDNVTLRGRFKATKIGDPSRRDEPKIISGILERFTKEGNQCRFQLGDWIKRGFIVRYTPQYKLNSDISWEMEISIVSSEEQTEEQRAGVFTTLPEGGGIDISQTLEAISREVNEGRRDLEGSGYIQKIPDIELIRVTRESITEQEAMELSQDELDAALNSIYPLRRYVSLIRGFRPIGKVFDFGEFLLDRYKMAIDFADDFITDYEEFSEATQRITPTINRFLLSIEDKRSRIYKIQSDLSNEGKRIMAGFDVLTRIPAYISLGSLSALITRVQQSIKQVEDSVRGEDPDVEDFYLVREGDTLQSLASQFYGDFARWQDIKSANELRSNDLVEGQSLVIPR